MRITTRCKGLAGIVVVDCRIVGREPLIGNVRRHEKCLHAEVIVGFLDKMKAAASQAKEASASFASSSAGALWSRYGDSMCEMVVTYANQAAAKGSTFIADDAKYQANVIDPTWEMLPMPVRMIGRERLKWDALFYAARSTVFVIDGDSVSVHPDAKQRVSRMLSEMLPADQAGVSKTGLPLEGGDVSCKDPAAGDCETAEPTDAADSR